VSQTETRTATRARADGDSLVAVDIGGTHARFAIATPGRAGTTIDLGEPITLKSHASASFQTAWEQFARQYGSPLPRRVAIAIAGPIGDPGDPNRVIRFTNNPWTIRPAALHAELGVDQVTLVNDFGAVGHAVAHLVAAGDYAHFIHLSGPEVPFPAGGTLSVVGPGTGLGVAHVLRGAPGTPPGWYNVQATEGGHVDFAPVDSVEDKLLVRLRARHRRVSAERVVSGPAIVDIVALLAAIEGRAAPGWDDTTAWQRGTAPAGSADSDSLARAAVERFCLSLGSVAGDLALAQGAGGVVIAGGLGYRIRETLLASGFAARFCAKGRFEAMMAALPVKLVTHPQPGLLGAAAAFLQEHRS
jgi:glucokinase